MKQIRQSDFKHHRVVKETGHYEVNGQWYQVIYTTQSGKDHLLIRKEVRGNGITEDTGTKSQLLMERDKDGLWDACRFKDFQAVTDYFNDLLAGDSV